MTRAGSSVLFWIGIALFIPCVVRQFVTSGNGVLRWMTALAAATAVILLVVDRLRPRRGQGN